MNRQIQIGSRKRQIRAFFWVWLVFGSALASSQAEETNRSLDTSNAVDLVFVLDNSGSMRKNDPGRIVADFVASFAKRLPTSHRLSVLLYDSNARVIMSLRPKPRDVLKNLDSASISEHLDYTGQFTFSAEAIEAASRELKQNGRQGAEKIIIFLTDGVIDTGDAQRDIDKRAWLFGSLSEELVLRGIKVFGLALGRNVDFEMVQTLSQKTGGDYYGVDSIDEAEGLFDKILQPPVKPQPVYTQPVLQEPASPEPVIALPLIQQESVIQPEPVYEEPTEPKQAPAKQEEPGTRSSPASNDQDSSAASDDFHWQFALVILGGMVALYLAYRVTRNLSPPVPVVAEKPEEPVAEEIKIPGACLEVPGKITGGAAELVELREIETWFGSNAEGSALLIDAETISAVHFRIVYDEGSRSFEVIDSSSNGTWILRARGQQRSPTKLERGKGYPLADGDRLVLPGYGMEAGMTFRLTSSGQDDRAGGATMLFGGHIAYLADERDKYEIENYSSVSLENGSIIVTDQPTGPALALIEIVDADTLLGVSYRLVTHAAGVVVNGENQAIDSQVDLIDGDELSFEHDSISRTLNVVIENEFLSADSFISTPSDGDSGSGTPTVIGRAPSLPENTFLDVDANEYRDGSPETVMMSAATKCHTHADVKAVSICSVCGDALCSRCAKRVDDADFCVTCLVRKARDAG